MIEQQEQSLVMLEGKGRISGMHSEEKKNIILRVLNIDDFEERDSLEPEKWDSLAHVLMIAELDEIGVQIRSEDLERCKTYSDILGLIP